MRDGWKITGTKEIFLKFEASGDHQCSRKVTGKSEITVDFVISTTFFEIEREKQEEEVQDFVRDVFPYLYTKIKISVPIFCIHLFLS